MATKVLEFEETDDKKYKVSFQASGKVHVFLDRVDNSDVFVYFYPENYDPVLYKKVTPDRTDVLLEFVIPGSGDIFVDIVSGTEVTQACYLTEEETFVYSVPASSVIFDDGKSFQQKLESGELKGQKGDKGATGATGAKGEKGADGKSVKAISLTADSSGKITGGKCTLSDNSTLTITVTTAAVSLHTGAVGIPSRFLFPRKCHNTSSWLSRPVPCIPCWLCYCRCRNFP